MKRHVTVIGGLPFGGIERMLLDLLPRLGDQGYDCRVVCIGGKEGAMVPLFQQAGVPVEHLRLRSRWGPLSLRRLGRSLRAGGADVVHSHGYAGNVSGSLAAARIGVPLVLGHVHTLGGLKRPHRARTERRAEQVRALTFAVSEAVRRDYLASTGADPSRVRVLHNGRSLRPFLAGRRNDEVATRLGIDPRRRLIGMVARLIPEKRPRDFLEMARRLIVPHPEAHFVIVGDGVEREDLEGAISRSGLERAVTLAGHRDDVPDLLAQMDLLVLPSEREGLPVVLVEAMASGVPVICTDVGGSSELIQEGVQGHLVRVGEVERMAGLAAGLLSDEPARRRMGERGRARAAEFAIERMAGRLSALYDELLDATRGPAAGRAS